MHVEARHRVLELGCGIGDTLAGIPCDLAVGVDCSPGMIQEARKGASGNGHRRLFCVGDNVRLPLRGTFDRILILPDTLGVSPDIQQLFSEAKAVSQESSRVVVVYYNTLWEPLLKLAERFGWRMPQKTQNWLPLEDIENLLYLSGFEVVKKGHRLLFPKHVPVLSAFINRFLARLPGIRRLCLLHWVIAKPVSQPKDPAEVSVSVMIPCRNEKGNIEGGVLRTPGMGKWTELIFVDGNSDDGTVQEIERMQKEHPDRRIQLIPQGDGKGKGDAVRRGFDAATGDVLMILDSDLTVPPEDLPNFFSALVAGKGEFINGCRMVYPMEKEAMRFFNILGNKFFGWAFTFLLEQRFRDTLCGTKVLWREDYLRIKKGRSYFGDFDPFGDFDLIFGASKQDLKIVELPVRYRERTYGITKIRRWYHGWLLLKMCWVASRKLKFAP